MTIRKKQPGRVVFLMAVGVAVLAGGSSVAVSDDCFQRDDNRRLSFEVFQAAAPPSYSSAERDYAASYLAYPGSYFFTTFMERLDAPSPSSTSGFRFRKGFFLWVNRCIFIPGQTPNVAACRNRHRAKGNGYFNIVKEADGRQVRPAFTTYARADACTVIQLKRVLGDFSSDLHEAANAAGLVLWDGSDRRGLAKLASRVRMSNGQEMPYFVDVCILEARALSSDADGVVLDYEVWDDRSPKQTLDLITALRNLAGAKGKRLMVATNPIPRVPSGITAENVRDIVATVDGFIPSISTGATVGNESIGFEPRGRSMSHMESYRAQLAVLTNHGRADLTRDQKAKIAWNIGLFDIQLDEARQLHDEIKSQGFLGILIARAFMKQGGSCSRQENQITACLAFGECSGKFGDKR